MFNINEAPSGTAEVENVASMFCKDDTPFAPICANFVFAFVGKNPEMFNGVCILHLFVSFHFFKKTFPVEDIVGDNFEKYASRKQYETILSLFSINEIKEISIL